MIQLLTTIPKQLLPALGIPLVELFPDLCLGWWTPPSLNLNEYNRRSFLRILLQIIAWYPVFEMVLPLCPDGGYFSLLVIASAFSILSRPYLTKKQIDRVTSLPLWNTSLPHDKRRAIFVVVTSSKPSDINKFEEMSARYANFPTKISGMVMGGIVNLLYYKLNNDEERMKLLVLLAVYVIGGLGIGASRHGNLLVDIFFRFVFSVGFLALLHYLGEVSDIALIENTKA
mmetsp:Transcript_23611/g.48882  ORF Transcript_23611/g.48882 Transcript_23611/m.48882 type:complete len:229 (+) Transcript_23611:124-810(+)